MSAATAEHPPGAAGRIGVLLVNLGTPEATDYWSIRRYLAEFLSDRRLMQMRRQPAIRVLPPYYDDPLYIDAVASSLEAKLVKLAFKPEVILVSFHGMPREYVVKGDPYQDHCAATARLLRERLELDEERLPMSFQSRFGSAEWLTPYTDATVEALAERGVKNLAVVMPGFAEDCLETLEEIAGENAEIVRHHGGRKFAAIPCRH